MFHFIFKQVPLALEFHMINHGTLINIKNILPALILTHVYMVAAVQMST